MINKVFLSLKNACNGLKYCFLTQRNMVIHAVIGTIVLVAALLLQVSLTGMLLLFTAVIFVLTAEAFNTALEQTIDLITRERKLLAKNAKDISSGAVLLASLFAVVLGLCILGPPIWFLFKELFLSH